MIKGISHIGIAVRNIIQTRDRLCRVLGMDPPPIKVFPERQIKCCVIAMGHTSIELLEDTDPGGPLYPAVEQRGSHIHHFCLHSDQLDQDISLFQKRGAVVSQPALGLRGKRVAFTTPELLDGIPIEISEG